MTNLSFYKSRKIRKTTGIPPAAVKATSLMIGVAFVLLAVWTFLSPQPAHAEENGQQKLVRQLKQKPQIRYDRTVRQSLHLQKDFGNPVSALQTLDYLFGKIEKRVKPRAKYNKEEAIEALRAIDGVLKEEGRFEYRKNNILIEGLEKQENGKRFIDCDDYSSIYIFAGERLGLSLEPVYVPRHVFLRCSIDDYTSFYWEPTVAAEKDFGFYKNWLNMKDESSYPKILNEQEFEAIHVCNLGTAWYEKADYSKVIEYSERAIKLDPEYAVAFNNLGVAHAKQGNLDLAVECYKKAISINPYYAAAFSNIGIAFYRRGYLKEAVEYFEKALEVDPKYDRAYDNRAAVLIEKGKAQSAFNLANKRPDLEQKNRPKD